MSLARARAVAWGAHGRAAADAAAEVRLVMRAWNGAAAAIAGLRKQEELKGMIQSLHVSFGRTSGA